MPISTGYLHCLDANTGQAYWTHDTLSAVWGSPIAIDGKVYLGDEDGDVLVLDAAKQEKLISTNGMGSNVYSTPGSSQRNPVRDEPEPAFRDCAEAGSGQAKACPTKHSGRGHALACPLLIFLVGPACWARG